MPFPRLTFFCELEAAELQQLFADPNLVEDLRSLNAGLSLGILDLSPERADVVRKVNVAGVPVTAWLLLPKDQGYWFNTDNVVHAKAFYDQFHKWTFENGLQWEAIGVDIEPNIQEIEQAFNHPRQLFPKLLRRLFDRKRLSRAEAAYADLAKTIHTDGYLLESYQFPVIGDERKIGSNLLRRMTSLVDFPADREVWMLYSYWLRPHGAGLVWSYAPEAEAIAIGSTGGGDAEASGTGHLQTLSWDELARDLRLAWYWNNQLYIFSLEGCIREGFFDRLKDFAWDQPILFPESSTEVVNRWRGGLNSILWLSRYFRTLLFSSLASLLLISQLRQYLTRRRKMA